MNYCNAKILEQERNEGLDAYYSRFASFQLDGAEYPRDAGTEPKACLLPEWYPKSLRGWFRQIGRNLDGLCQNRRERLLA